MIYFLVNNDYQLYDARRHLLALRNSDLSSGLIEVPHTLNSPNRGEGFDSICRFVSPLTKHGWLGAWARYFASARDVHSALHPAADDVLLLYTEYELLNHFIALRFKRANARVYLLEDGGVATYIPFSLPMREQLSVKERVIATMTRCLPHLGETQFHKVNGMVFPWLPDRFIDGICVYRPLEVVREIPIQMMCRPGTLRIRPICGRVIFLNERMYDLYQTPDQYMDGLDRILSALSKGFVEVHFKFHPREEDNWRQRIRRLLNDRHPKVRIIEDTQAIEELVAEMRPEVLASYFSAALLNVGSPDIEPMFLYQLLPELNCQKVFMQLSALLKKWNYQFVGSFEAACSGYRSAVTLTSNGATQSSLVDLLKPRLNSVAFSDADTTCGGYIASAHERN